MPPLLETTRFNPAIHASKFQTPKLASLTQDIAGDGVILKIEKPDSDKITLAVPREHLQTGTFLSVAKQYTEREQANVEYPVDMKIQYDPEEKFLKEVEGPGYTGAARTKEQPLQHLLASENPALTQLPGFSHNMNLQHLDLSGAAHLTQIPDFSSLTN